MPYHLLLDSAGEAKLGSLQIGTTRRGIGPCYADKAARLGIRVQDLLDEKILKKKIVAAMEPKRLSLRPFEKDPALDLHTMTEEYLTFGHRLEQHIADTSKLMWQMLDERTDGDPRGRAGRDARHRPRHLSVRHLLQPARGRRVRRQRHRAEGDRRGVGHLQGLHHARGRGPVPERAARRDGRDDPRARRRVRHDHRPPAAHRLARPRGAALRGAPEHDDLAGDHQARRALGPRPHPGVHELPAAATARSSRTSPTTRRCCTTPPPSSPSCPAGRRTSASAARSPTCPTARASTSTSSPSTSASEIALIGVGPGREQVVWTEAGKRTIIAGNAATTQA